MLLEEQHKLPPLVLLCLSRVTATPQQEAEETNSN